jgi:adenylosuccinate lyase
VGNYAHLPPWAEAYVCERLGLVPEAVSTQIVSRDRHAELLCALAVTAGSLERIATEIRSLQRTEIHEVEEPFEVGQTGSSGMPHKRNPILCERITGLARMLRGMSLVALENEALWGERDISHSSNERLTLPGATTLLHYALRQMRYVLTHLRIYPENMRRNLDRAGGLVYSHRVLLLLVERGMPREEAYRAVQQAAFRVEEDPHRAPDAFLRALLEDPAIRRYADEAVLQACFDPAPYLAHVDEILSRVGILPKEKPA